MTDILHTTITVLPDLEAVSSRAAEIFLDSSRNCINARGRFAVALSGGSTPRRLYSLLGSGRYRDEIDWKHVHLFWADERCVPGDHQESNFKAAFDLFLSKVPVPPGNIHRIKGEKGAGAAAGEYESDLRKFFSAPASPSFDLIILGVGEDGHTASLFPGSPSLAEVSKLAVPVFKESPGINRVTLTFPVLNSASQVLFLVSGRAKGPVVHDILETGNAEHYPAGLVLPERGGATWLLDSEAAEALESVR